ncbi:MAG: TetR/AcrR family transcriptional regulator [Acidimicrobiales bacterium]
MSRPSPREELLRAAVEHVCAHGVSDLSLRELARAIGTSHRMLIYHFGSKEELFVAIVEENEKAQRDSLLAAFAKGDATPAEMLRWAWERLADPSMWPSERLFFELYGQALQNKSGTASFLDEIVSSWIEPAARLQSELGETAERARARARLNLAIVRGLLLDLLATRDVEGTRAAMELYAEMLENE